MSRNTNEAVLVVGATGTVGGAVMRALLGRGARVRALVRPHPSSPTLPLQVTEQPRVRALQGAEVITGDLADVSVVRGALTGVRSAFYVSPHEANEVALAELFIRECERAKVRLVFVGVHVPGPNRLLRALYRWLFGWFMPHYRPKFRIAERARTCKADPVVLMPTNFFQNDEQFQAQIMSGTFSQPFLRPINRVDVRDIGDAAARACLDDSLASGAYPLVGTKSLDAEECAQIWSSALGRDVKADPASFEASLPRELAAKKRADFCASYAAIRKLNIATRAEDVAQATALLGREPTTYAAYVEHTARAWRSAAAA